MPVNLFEHPLLPVKQWLCANMIRRKRLWLSMNIENLDRTARVLLLTWKIWFFVMGQQKQWEGAQLRKACFIVLRRVKAGRRT